MAQVASLMMLMVAILAGAMSAEAGWWKPTPKYTVQKGQRYWAGGYRVGVPEDCLSRNYQTPSADKCGNACAKHSKCQIYTWDSKGKQCYMYPTKFVKGYATPDKRYTSGSCSGKKVNTPPPKATDYIVETGKRCGGTPYKAPVQKNTVSCRDLCDREPLCYAFAYHKATKTCSLYTTIVFVPPPSKPDNTYTSGWCIKNNPPPPKVSTPASCSPPVYHPVSNPVACSPPVYHPVSNPVACSPPVYHPVSSPPPPTSCSPPPSPPPPTSCSPPPSPPPPTSCSPPPSPPPPTACSPPPSPPPPTSCSPPPSPPPPTACSPPPSPPPPSSCPPPPSPPPPSPPPPGTPVYSAPPPSPPPPGTPPPAGRNCYTQGGFFFSNLKASNSGLGDYGSFIHLNIASAADCKALCLAKADCEFYNYGNYQNSIPGQCELIAYNSTINILVDAYAQNGKCYA